MNLKEEIPNEKPNAIVPYPQGKSNTKIVLSNQTNADLNALTQSLATQAQNATSIAELQEIVNLLPKVDDVRGTRIKQSMDELEITKGEETINSIRFDRKMKAVREAFRITASVGSVAIGLYLITISPLLSPLLLTLGIAGALNYRLKDVTELASKINDSKRSYEIEPYNGNQDKI